MSDPFLGELRVVAFTFVPKGWASCDGQLLPINQNQALFSLLGTIYGGDGVTNFALPNLRDRMPIHFGAGFTQGEAGGAASHTVTPSEMPLHSHGGGLPAVLATATAGAGPVGNRFANAPAQPYRTPTPAVQLTTLPTTSVGGAQPHENMQPYLALRFCIALQGIFPPRN